VRRVMMSSSRPRRNGGRRARAAARCAGAAVMRRQCRARPHGHPSTSWVRLCRQGLVQPRSPCPTPPSLYLSHARFRHVLREGVRLQALELVGALGRQEGVVSLGDDDVAKVAERALPVLGLVPLPLLVQDVGGGRAAAAGAWREGMRRWGRGEGGKGNRGARGRGIALAPSTNSYLARWAAWRSDSPTRAGSRFLAPA
jgi:hypothetical protein